MNKYNKIPDDWREITPKDFWRLFRLYQYAANINEHTRQPEPFELRQPSFPDIGIFSTHLLHLAARQGLGIAIRFEGYTPIFARFGDAAQWDEFEGAVAAQMAGDNT